MKGKIREKKVPEYSKYDENYAINNVKSHIEPSIKRINNIKEQISGNRDRITRFLFGRKYPLLAYGNEITKVAIRSYNIIKDEDGGEILSVQFFKIPDSSKTYEITYREFMTRLLNENMSNDDNQ